MKDKFKRFTYQRIHFQIRCYHHPENIIFEDKWILELLESSISDEDLYNNKEFMKVFKRRFKVL